jgi:hypothetical protein
MQKETVQPELINLSFSMESSGTLWNVIFEGFDQEVVLVSKFTGKEPKAVNTLYRFGFLISERYKDCKVAPKHTGIEIRKSLPENGFELVNEWTTLMENVREEMTSLMPGPQ